MKKKDKEQEQKLLDMRDPVGRILAGSDGLKVYNACEVVDRCKLKLSVLEYTFRCLSLDDEQIEPVCFGDGMAFILHDMIDELVNAHEYLDAVSTYNEGLDQERAYQSSGEEG
jgi:hypothetical protein